MLLARGLLGIAVLIGLAWLMSSNKRRFPLKIVVGGLALQWALAWVVLRTNAGRAFFDGIARIVTTVLYGADEAAGFVFGPLAGSHPQVAWPAIAGIKIMTTIIIMASLSAIGYHYGILQRIVGGMAWVMKRTMGVSGSESLAGAANVFVVAAANHSDRLHTPEELTVIEGDHVRGLKAISSDAMSDVIVGIDVGHAAGAQPDCREDGARAAPLVEAR